MGQFQLKADPNSLNLARVQGLINDFNSRSGAQQFLNLTNKSGSGDIYITDNKDSPLFSQANRDNINSFGSDLQGYSQSVGTPTKYINFNAPTGKSPTNILVHEVGHEKWPGLGTDATGHDPLFYKLLNDFLKALGLPVDSELDLRNIDIDNVPSPVPSGTSPLDYNIRSRRSDAGDDNNSADLASAHDPNDWQISSSSDGKTLSETRFSSDGDAIATIDYAIGDDGIEHIKISSYDDGALEKQQDVFTNGTTAIKYLDTRNTHPYSELEITEDSTGKITSAKPKIDGQSGNVDFSVVGQVLGSALGRALAPNNQFVQIVASTVVGAVGQKLAQAFAASLTTDAATINLASAFSDFNISIAGAGASSVALFLVAELGTKLGLDGFGAQLFNGGVGGFTGSVASQIATRMVQGYAFDAAIGAVNFGSAAASAGYGISGLLGSYLGHELVPAETHEGAVGGQLFGAIGSAIGITAALSGALNVVLGFIAPGIGSLIGTILGTLIGDLLGSHPHPAAVDLIDQAGALYGYTHSQVSASDGGDWSIPDQMAPAAVAIVNTYLGAVKGAALDHSKQIQIGYVTDPDFRYISGWGPTHKYLSFVHADDAVHAAALDALQHLEVIGGDLLMKRAHQALIHGSHPNRIPSAKTRRRARAGGWRRVRRATARMTCIRKRFA